MAKSKSKYYFSRAQKVIPGGVNSPVRAFKGVGGDPIYFKKAMGAYLLDEDDQHYIDYVGSWGPIILGHCHPSVVKAIQDVSQQCLSFGAPYYLEVLLAEKICQLMPNIENVRMVNSGTEATMSAVRLARGVTGRNKIIKFAGCYHGHSDSLLVKAGSGLLTFGIPSSPGVPAVFAEHTLVADFNNLDSVQKIFESYPDDIAAIIVEPVAANMNCVLPAKNFLQGLRELCDQYQSILIFDEVITGFRVSLHGAQHYFNVKPDLTTLGKIIGGGLPVGALGGKRELMQQLAPQGNVYQAGTLSGNPLAMAAGLATLNELTKEDFYPPLEQLTIKLTNGLRELANIAQIPFQAIQIGSVFGLFFNHQLPQNFTQVMQSNVEHYKIFFHALLQEGIYLAPSAYEVGFVSSAHTEKEIEITLAAAEKAFDLISVNRQTVAFL